ncbi:MAG TPA: prepilin-type N-terminal cleavage/methylation domain-containing protein [Bacteroidales bacterium]|nr:prepilin-type N-terminal cleavage/methylation domain-containing protein [Bacteroidales bacterium]
MKHNIYETIKFRDSLKKNACYHEEDGARGFTIVELLVAMGIGLVLIAALYNLFTIQNKSFNTQELIVEMQQNARAAMDMMASEIRMAGYDPAASTSSGIASASSNSITVKQNLNGDADLDDNNENITYGYDSTNLRITRNTGGGAQPFAENIEALTFSYFDVGDNNLGTSPTSADIRKIKIEILARTARKDPDYGSNGGYRTFKLTSYVTPRNLAY